MARRNDLAGLAALGALGLLLNKKQDGSSVPVEDRGARAAAASVADSAQGKADEDLGAIYAEDGTRSKLRRNLETGDLYSPDEAITRPRATASASKRPSTPATVKQPVVGDPGGSYDASPAERPMVDPERRKNYGMLESIKGYYSGNPFSAASAKREAMNALNATAGLSVPGFVGNTTQKQYNAAAAARRAAEGFSPAESLAARGAAASTKAQATPRASSSARRSAEGFSPEEALAARQQKALSEADWTGGAVGYKKGGKVKKAAPARSSASSRGDGIAKRGKTRGKMF